MTTASVWMTSNSSSLTCSLATCSRALARLSRGCPKLFPTSTTQVWCTDTRPTGTSCCTSLGGNLSSESTSLERAEIRVLTGLLTTKTPKFARVSRALPKPSRLEQGNRGTGEQGKETPSKPPASKPTPNQFDHFWEWYPRKVGKEAARKAWDKARTKTDQLTIIEGLERYRLDPNLPAKEFIPHPSTWLNEGRWDDEPLPARGGQMRPTGSQVRLQAGFELLQRVQQQEQQILQIED